MQDFLEYVQVCYYSGCPVMSDAEYDRLEMLYGNSKVGYSITDGLPHLIPMYSLQKCFDINEAPLDVEQCHVTSKLDGAAVSLLYSNQTLQLGLTRGDGKLGRDITEKLATLVPSTIDTKETVQITGEVVCPKHIANARNVAAGSLNLKDMQEFKERPLSFIAYDMQTSSKPAKSTYSEVMAYLSSQGFKTIFCSFWPEYPHDGLVYRLDNNEEYARLGYTSHHPRGAFALKEQKQGVITKLIDVIWQVGKSGVVSPVALLEPVDIDGAVVQKATLHNIEYIEGLNLELGCQVEVIRSGDIIPRVVCRID